VAGRGPPGSYASRGLHGAAPWFLGYHALTTLDYDLTAEFEPWEPPQPLDENGDRVARLEERMNSIGHELGDLRELTAEVVRRLARNTNG